MNSLFRNFLKITKFSYSKKIKSKPKEIVNYTYKIKEMPDFSKSLPNSRVKVSLRKSRAQTKIKEIM